MATVTTTAGINRYNGLGGANNTTSGDDTINVAAGTITNGDILRGGAGNDTIALTTAADTSYDFSTITVAKVENLVGNTGNDTVTLTGTQISQFLNIDLGAGSNDALNIKVTGDDFVWADDVQATLTGVESVTITAAGSGDTLIAGGNIATTIVGNSGNNEIYGGTALDTINANDGDDLISGGGGDDIISAGSGTDTVLLSGEFGDYTFSTDGFGNLIADNGTDAITITGAEVLDFETGSDARVAAGAGSEYATVQDAVDASVDSEIVLVVGDVTEDVVVTSKAINITGLSAGTTTLTGKITFDGTLDNPAAVTDLVIDATGKDYGVNVTANSNAFAGSFTLDGVSISGASQNGFAYIRDGNGGSPSQTDTLGNISILNSSFSNNGVVDTGSNGRGDIILFGYNQDLTIADTTIGSPGAFAQKAIQLRGTQQGGDVAGVGPYAMGGDVSISNVTVSGNYLQDGLAVYRFAGFSSFTFSGTTFNDATTNGFGIVNFDSVGGAIDLSTGLTITNGGTGPATLLQGLSSAETSTGTAGNDVLSGRLGADTLTGLGGNDTYVVNDNGDVIVEAASGGTDTVAALASYDLTAGAEIETLNVATVASGVVLKGNAFDQTLNGNTGDNTLFGLDGNDLINGGSGNDTAGYTGAMGAYQVEVTSTGLTITGEGTDTLTSIENLDFNGSVVAVADLISTTADANAAANSVAENAAGAVLGINAYATDANFDAVTYSLDDDAGGRFQIDSGTGVVTTTAALNFEVDPSSYSITVRSTSADGSFSRESFTINLLDANDAPTVGAPIDLGTTPEDVGITFSDAQLLAGAADEDGDTPVVDGNSVTALHGTVSYSMGTYTYTPDADYFGAETFSYTVADGNGGTVAQTATLSLTAVNDAPVVDNAIGAQSVAEDTAWSYQVPANTFSDVDGDTLTYTATLSNNAPLPGWLSFNAATRTFSGTPPQDYNGGFQFKVTASDGSLTASSTFTLTVTAVNDAPVVDNAIAGQSVAEDNAWSFEVPANTFSDVDGDTLTYTATLSDDNLLPGWLSFDGGTRTFSGTPPPDFNGIIGLKVTASDGALTASSTFNLTVTVVNDAPTDVTAAGALSANEGNATIGDVVATLTGVDVDTGDTIPDTLTLSLQNSAGGRFQLVGNSLQVAAPLLLDFEQATFHDVTVRVTDAAGASYDKVITINVDDVASENLTGSAGADTLVGGANADIFNGAGGADSLTGGGGADTITGGAGADTVAGGTGNDIFQFSVVGDVVAGDSIDGGADTDMMQFTAAGTFDMRVATMTSIETIDMTVGSTVAVNGTQIGGAGISSSVLLDGSAGSDVFRIYVSGGSFNASTLTFANWGVGNDLVDIVGSGGADTITGSSQNDLIRGGNGKDIMTGGAGADRFKYNTVAESSTNISLSDNITDFSSGTDRIDLTSIDASTLVAGDQAFSFIGSLAFSGSAGQLRYTTSGPNVIVEGDVDGNGAPDFRIILNGLSSMVGSDFIL